MAWLTREGEVLASLEVADSPNAWLRRLAGRDGLGGALLLPAPLVLHTIGVPHPVDVAFCDAELRVLRTACLNRWRLALPGPKVSRLVVGETGAFERWGLVAGDQLEVKGR
jgi:hypothetical protein